MGFSCPKKEIIYRGGVVRFFIPKHWNEEYEKEGGGTFYKLGEDTGTLRLNVLSFLTKEDLSPEQLLAIIKSQQKENCGQAEALPDNRFLLKYSINAEENGEAIVLIFWEITKMVSPRDYNIAVFAFTITAKQEKSVMMREEISSIEEEIKKVSFGIHGDSYEG